MVGIHEQVQVDPRLLVAVAAVALDRRIPRLREGRHFIVRFMLST